MPSPVQLLAERARTAAALLLLAAALGWAALAGEGAPVLAVAWVVAVALVLLAYDVVAWVFDERQPAGLAVDPGDPPLPDPWWEPVVGTAGLLVVGTGLLASSGWLGALGAVVLLVALAGWARRRRGDGGGLDRRTVRAARALQRGFAVAPALPEPLDPPAAAGAPPVAGRSADDDSAVRARVSPIGGGLQRLVVEQQGAVRADLVLRRAAQVARLAGLAVRTD